MTAEQSIRNIERTMDAVNAAARVTPKPDPRADLVDLFEARAETHYDKSWIEVEEAVDLVMDREAEVIQAAKAEAWDEGYRTCDQVWTETADIVTPDEDRTDPSNPYQRTTSGGAE